MLITYTKSHNKSKSPSLRFYLKNAQIKLKIIKINQITESKTQISGNIHRRRYYKPIEIKLNLKTIELCSLGFNHEQLQIKLKINIIY